MTDIVNTITLPLSDEAAQKLAAIPQGAAHTHTFTSVDGAHTHALSAPDKVIEAEEIN